MNELKYITMNFYNFLFEENRLLKESLSILSVQILKIRVLNENEYLVIQM